MADDCSWYDVTCQLGNLTEQTASTVTDAIVSTWAKAVLEGLDSVLTTLGTFWVKVPTPDVSDSGSVTAWAQGATHWLVIVLAALSTLTACIYLMWHQRGEEVRNIVRGLLTLIIVSAVSITMGQAVIDVADKSATWFLDQATGDPSSNFATKLLTISTIDPGGTTLIVAIVMGLIGLLANLVQMGMMFVRSAMVILLLSAIPLAAATTMTEWGQQWLRKMVGWFIAFAAMKPVAALIYGIAIKLVEGDSYDITDDGELLKFVLGTIMMVLAAFTLPALCAFIVPAVGAVGGGGSGAGALMAGAGGLATGAMSVSRLTGADGADGSGGPPGGGGASGGPGPAGGGGASGEPGPSGSGGASGGSGPAGSGGPPGGGGASGGPGPAGGGGTAGGGGAAAAGGGGAAAAGGGGAAAAGGGAGGGAAAAGAGAATGGAATVAMAVVQGVEAGADAAQSAASEATGSEEVAH